MSDDNHRADQPRRGKCGVGERSLDGVAIGLRRPLQSFGQRTTFRPVTADHAAVRHDHDVQHLQSNRNHDRFRFPPEHGGSDQFLGRQPSSAFPRQQFDADESLGRQPGSPADAKQHRGHSRFQ